MSLQQLNLQCEYRSDQTMKSLYLSSLRGIIGDWVYYPCLMKFRDIAERINLAEEIYDSKTLNELVQRELRQNRGKEIKAYLMQQEQRFVNSLVVAAYEGYPAWYGITNLRPNDKLDVRKVPDEVVESIGFLGLSGTERLFALDGQDRLVGIKEAVKENPELGDDELTVIFIAHNTDSSGKERSRRLFTTLNKNAKPISKGEIIALDEDDTMAITTRRLVMEHPMFMEDRILNNATNNIPPSNSTCLTTIGNLYDLLGILFTKIYVISKKKRPTEIKEELTKTRLSDEMLDRHYENASNYFTRLTSSFAPLTEFCTASDYSMVIKKHRNPAGGSILFRPIGLAIMTEIVATLIKNYPMDRCFELIAKLPTDLTAAPYNGVIWQPTRKRMTGGKVLVRNLLLYMLDAYNGDEGKLHQDYANALGVEQNQIHLPSVIKSAS